VSAVLVNIVLFKDVIAFDNLIVSNASSHEALAVWQLLGIGRSAAVDLIACV
jgi:hypothetical protein